MEEPHKLVKKNYIRIGQVLKIVGTYKSMDSMLDALLLRILTENSKKSAFGDNDILYILEYFEKFDNFQTRFTNVDSEVLESFHEFV